VNDFIGIAEASKKLAQGLSDAEIDKLYSAAEDLATDIERNPFYYWKPLPTQKKFLECPERIVALCGGNQGGKTTTGTYYVIDDCLKNPGHKWWAGAETWEVSRLVQQAKFNEMLPADQLDFCNYNPEHGFFKNIIKFKNGSTISFRSYDQKRERWQGATLHGILFDEEPPWDIYQEGLARVLKNHGKIIFTMTALKGYTKLVEELLVNKKAGTKCFFISTYENVKENGGALDRADIEAMEANIDADERQARLSGIPTLKSGLVFGSVFKHEMPHVIPYNKEFKPSNKWPTICSIDPHPKTPHAVLWTQVDASGHLWVVRERPWLVDPQTLEKKQWCSIKELVREVAYFNEAVVIHANIIDKHAAHSENAITNTSIQDELMKEGLFTQDAGGEVDVKIALTQQMFRQGKIHIFESCWNVLWEATRYIWDDYISQRQKDRKEEKQKPRKKNDHLIDCLMNTVLYLSNCGLLVTPTSSLSHRRNPQEFDKLDEKNINYTQREDRQPTLMESYE
jgi:phage terminase large subunit-like protein